SACFFASTDILATIQALNNLGILHLVDLVICGDDEQTHPKPDPHNGLLICDKLSVEPNEVVMVGDTPTDVKFAKNSRFGLTLGVLSGVGRRSDLEHAWYGSVMTELNVRQLENSKFQIIPSVADIIPIVLPNSPVPVRVRPRLSSTSQCDSTKKYKLVILDKNGSLTDVHPRWSNWAEVISSRLREITSARIADKFMEMIGYDAESRRVSGGMLPDCSILHIRDCLGYLLNLNGYDQRSSSEIVNKVWFVPDSDADDLLPGVVETITHLRQHGVAIALNTSDSREVSRKFLSCTGLEGKIDYVLSAEDAGKHPKPLPHTVYHVLNALGVSPVFVYPTCNMKPVNRYETHQPDEAIVVGDTPSDLISVQIFAMLKAVGIHGNAFFNSFGRSVQRASLSSFFFRNSPLPFVSTTKRWKATYRRNSKISFDYIIVGAGSAGCVLANRLSAPRSSTSSLRSNADASSVHLLEAGPTDEGWSRWTIRMPAALMYNLYDGKYNWYYHTVPQRHMNNRVMYWPRGRVLGGSSSLNAMVYIRGHPMDYDRWEREGATGWNFGNCLPYFRRSQTHELGGDEYRGGSGPLYVSRGKTNHPLHEAWLKAGQESGYHFTEDVNGYQQEGVGYFDMTIKDGQRCSAATAYLHPIKHSRPNLKITTKALVTRILFEGTRAVGVEYLQDGSLYETRAEREVILSGGAINSPQLLMLSGIGHVDYLRSIGIDAWHQLPGVGQNLQDHLEVYVQNACDEVHVGPMRPRGTGQLLLVSADPKAPPKIDPNYMSCESDREDMRRCIRLSREIFAQPSLAKRFGGYEIRPGSEKKTNAELDKFVRELADSAYHPSCTCRMGLNPEGRPVTEQDIQQRGYLGNGIVEAAVTRPDCKVWGLDGLRVVDASIMPSIISGNLNAPVIMMAERAADLILSDRDGKSVMLSPATGVKYWTPKFPKQQRDMKPEVRLEC
ncbi:haloacid dehalogenase-like hydrolase, partial [Opisthorchis viverrini]